MATKSDKPALARPERRFTFHIAGGAGAEVSYYNWHTGKFSVATFDEKGQFATDQAGVGEALEMMVDQGHPLLKLGPVKGA